MSAIYEGYQKNKPRPCGISERLAQYAAKIGHDDVAAQLRGEAKSRKEAIATYRVEYAKDVAHARARHATLEQVAPAAADRMRRSSDLSSTVSSSGDGASSSSSAAAAAAAGRGGSRSRRSSSSRTSGNSDTWYVASSGPYVSPEAAARLDRRASQAKALGGPFSRHFGKASHMPLRSDGVVANSGAYHGKPGRFDCQRKADPGFARVEDPAKRPRQVTRAWRPIADRRSAAKTY